jgi:hypothetical protein
MSIEIYHKQSLRDAETDKMKAVAGIGLTEVRCKVEETSSGK